MLDYSRVEKTRTETLGYLPNVNLLLKISLGLILFTIISAALVYAETESVTVDGTSYDVSYTGTEMTVSGIEADTDFISLILTVDVTGSSGTLDITFDRSFFDSIYNEADDDFIILIDGDEPTFTETQTNSISRTLSIELPAGSEEVEIIGSSFNNSVAEETPVEETPVEETPVEETPVEETPVEETPVEETPVEETPVEETPADTTPKTQCGPGTVLKDGACVLDSTSSLSSSGGQGMGKESIMGFVVAFLGAGIVAVVFGIIARSQKK